jgi:3-isopropylmalate dehydrogenase
VKARIAVLPGDGVGPEVTAAAVGVLDAVAERFGHELELLERPVGWTAVRATGDPLPPETLAACRSADAILLGAVGHPVAESEPRERRPEAGLLRLRRELGLWANLRPVRVRDTLVDRSALRPERVRGTDVLIVRELGGGIYYGEPRGTQPGPPERAVDTEVYEVAEIERIARLAFQLARARRGHGRPGRVASVDKANVLETSALWRRVVTRVAAEFGDVTLRHVLVDRAAMELVLAPAELDVVLAGNLFGDILSDEAAAIAGSIGLLGSASLGDGPGLYEPVHGSAPEIAGEDVANPAGAIESVALLLRHALGLEAEAAAVGAALDAALAGHARTADLTGPGDTPIGTAAFGHAVAERVTEAALIPASGRRAG